MKYQIPAEDHWFIERLAVQIQKLIVRPELDRSLHPGLLRVLFAIQRLPNLANMTNFSLCICDGKDAVYTSGHYTLSISSDGFGFTHYTEDNHTDFRLNYFRGSSNCIEGFTTLEGESKRGALLMHMEEFELQTLEGVVMLEDYSDGAVVDVPPLQIFKN